jgi:hypothetical protein
MSSGLLRTAFVASLAAVVLAQVVGVASARRFSISEQRFDARWPSMKFTGAGNAIECPVSVEGSFHSRSISKVEGALIGQVTRSSVNNAACTGGQVTILTATLPWHLQYAGFSGRLPSIEVIAVHLINASAQVQPTGGIACLIRSTTEWSLRVRLVIIGLFFLWLEYESTTEIPLTGGFACSLAGNGHVEGRTSSLTALGSTREISVSLVQ